jgi:hypothetical protein
MEIDKEIQKVIDDYVEKISENEEALLKLKSDIDQIIHNSEKELIELENNLDQKFNTNVLSEEEYLKLFKNNKENILSKTKQKMDELLASLS